MDKKMIVALLMKEEGTQNRQELASVPPSELMQIYADEQKRIHRSFKVRCMHWTMAISEILFNLTMFLGMLVMTLLKNGFKYWIKKADMHTIDNKAVYSQYYRKVYFGNEIQNAVLRIATESSDKELQTLLALGMWNRDAALRRRSIDRLIEILRGVKKPTPNPFHSDCNSSMITYLSSLEHSEEESELMFALIGYFTRIKYRPLYECLKHIVSITAKTETQQLVQDRALNYIETCRLLSKDWKGR